jgi:nitroimidazol reductase NimA-like FMN-containing flavoprotein (pyridoxamine 5'-phosphate oxidase superfamily)
MRPPESRPLTTGPEPPSPGAAEPATPSRRLIELTRDECLQRLRTEHVGRVVVVTPALRPLVRPVDYVFDERSQAVAFRSRRGSKLHALAHAERACFEIDGIDSRPGVAWSVIVTGVVETVTGDGEIERLARLGLDTRVTGESGAWLRIRTNVVSGRRVE